MKICHISSVHSRHDVRIYIKEISSLRQNGYDVTYIVADGKGNDDDNHILDVGKASNRVARIFSVQRKIFQKVMKLGFDVCHFHDPELMFLGHKLKKKGKKVIYDVHEDLPRQLLSKPYLKLLFPKLISRIVEYLEDRISKKFDYIITATPTINERFMKNVSKARSIMNFPIIDEIDFNENKDFKQKKQIVYIGSITKVRGILELVEACTGLDVDLTIAGPFDEVGYKNDLLELEGWKNVNYRGYADRNEVNRILKDAHVGISVLYPIENYLTSYPVKMFEYMAAGIPVIASNFDLWETILVENKCGLVVEPKDTDEMKKTIEFLIENPELAAEMGKNGRKAVLEKFNWTNEEQKLLSIYKQVIDDK